MTVVTGSKGKFTVKAYVGDAKTLLAFNLDKPGSSNLAGFTICAQPKGKPAYFLFNSLQFEKPSQHAQDATEPPYSSLNAPIHKFRWVHVPGSMHQGLSPFLGEYTYVVTPRYFNDKNSLLPLDPALSASVTVDVVPFEKGNLSLGFTRGFVQSQAFVHHFGRTAPIQPDGGTLLFDTSAEAGTNAAGEKFTFADEYAWLGFTAREKILALIDRVIAAKTLALDVFAYDLNEPDIMARLLKLAGEGRVRVILDDAALHHSTKDPKREDQFETLFRQKAKKDAAILRGNFDRYAHDKVLIVRTKTGKAKTVLTGSTNFSVTGLYVNSNHVLVFDDPDVADTYEQVFQAAWDAGARTAKWEQSELSTKRVPFKSKDLPEMEVSFSPHEQTFAETLMNDLSTRVKQEGKKGKTIGSVLFAVMDLGSGDGPVRPTLIALHDDESIFSYGISDSTKGMRLYAPGKKRGVLVSGKPTKTKLPEPFSQVPGVGLGHQIHHKFVVCGFNTPDAVVYCGSSNLATGGEMANGDNLLAIHDQDVATAFAIEALTLVDHFDFLDRLGQAPAATGTTTTTAPPASKQNAAAEAHWYLSTTDTWAKKYYDTNDFKSVDRRLFGE
jgi:hypothetical protein